MDEKGKIRHRQYATQVRDFSGLRFGNITPTDIDALLEYRNLGFIIIETKYRGTFLPAGQRLALERLCDNLRKPTLLIIACHDTSGDIDFATTQVVEYRYDHKWYVSRRLVTTYELVQRFVEFLESGPQRKEKRQREWLALNQGCDPRRG